MTRKFLRRNWNRFLRIGRKKKLAWRKPKGRDNKMREKRGGYPRIVSIGYKKSSNQKAILVRNIKELENAGKENIIIIGKIGKKKKIEIAKKAKEKNIKIWNLNAEKFLEEIKQEGTKREESKIKSDKKKK